MEYRVKAAFLYNFAKFIEWPASAEPGAGNTFAYCILGANPFGRILDQTLSGKSVRGTPTKVRHVETAAAATFCQVVFISSSERNRIPAIVEALSTAAVLTVSETPGFTERGGMINFVLEDDRVHFQINPDRARQAGLHISSHLLRLARVVGRRPGGGQ